MHCRRSGAAVGPWPGAQSPATAGDSQRPGLARRSLRAGPTAGRGAALARAIALCSYKSSELFSERFARRPDRSGEDPQSSLSARYDVAGYLDYQGSIFTTRFDANSYLVLSKAMDTFDLAYGDQSEASFETALRRIRAQLLLVGISSDWLFPASDVRALAWAARSAGVNANYAELTSSHGHDGFLAEAPQLAPIIKAHLEEEQLTLLGAGRR